MEMYRSRDVAERCRWQMKRRLRSGSSRNFAKRIASRKFRTPQQDIAGLISKGSRPRHSRKRKSSRFLCLSRKCFIFLEFWMIAFPHRPCKSRAKFKHNLIRRDIEVVITGLTRNQFVRKHTWVRIPLSPPNAVQDREKKPQSSDVLRLFH